MSIVTIHSQIIASFKQKVKFTLCLPTNQVIYFGTNYWVFLNKKIAIDFIPLQLSKFPLIFEFEWTSFFILNDLFVTSYWFFVCILAFHNNTKLQQFVCLQTHIEYDMLRSHIKEYKGGSNDDLNLNMQQTNILSKGNMQWTTFGEKSSKYMNRSQDQVPFQGLLVGKWVTHTPNSIMDYQSHLPYIEIVHNLPLNPNILISI